ncbi:efflux RND transporter periplasmic adaptor subunit [Chitinophaga silvisoli]|uniref:Efflux RND transporter periplasmic adaptor subunit n=1 Tax=Chitinophaga silvisoli TaxID=2291814 RepID=A0A3E1P7Q0_9BACT|nr:efflux RND transporter periplasmic adaptor subunit [Chitinophaga silvisoli]RFM36177.1 efflux RND transporter periplasmic adaptor subunit [Chitinophaga silvisoli]
MMYRIFYIGLAIILLSACHNSTATTTNSQDTSTCIISTGLKPLIQLTPLSEAPVHGELELTGSVSYDQDHLYRYQSLASGVVKDVRFNLGDYVIKGQVLAEIRTTELSDQSAGLRKAEAALTLSERQLRATGSLHDDGIASDKELLEAQNEVAADKLEINRIKETLTIQGGSVDKGVLLIHAPMSGYIVGKKMTTGYQVNAGDDDLFIISDLKKVWVMANVYAAQLGMVKVGQEVAISTTAYPGKVFAGKIARLSNIFDPEEKVMKAVVEIDNAGLELKPDMMVSVNVHMNMEEKALAVPLNAVIFDDDTYHVVAYHGDCDVRELTISPLSHDKQFYYVNEDVLHKGDTIISRNQLLIYNQLKGR